MRLGGGRVRTAGQQRQLALDAQQLGRAPALFVTLGAVDGAVDRRHAGRDVARPAQCFGQIARDRGVRQGEAGVGEFADAGAQDCLPHWPSPSARRSAAM